MNDSVADLLRRGADALPERRFDVGALVAEATRRQRRRRFAVVAAATALMATAVIGTFAIRDGQPRNVEPAPSPSPTVVDPPAATRPLVYAAGRTVHVGDRTFDAGADVVFLDATDDGVVFVTEDSDRWWYSDTLWFNDGSTTEAIGRVATEHLGMFEVSTANPGSLVVWAEGRTTREAVERFVVYDTARRQVVARVPFTGYFNVVLHADRTHVYYNPDSTTPGCWVIDVHSCKSPHLLRYELASGDIRRIPRDSFEATLRSTRRMLVLSEARGDTGTALTARAMARFNQVGRRLVPVDADGDPTVYRRPTGEPVELRVPAGYRSRGSEMPVVQWIDDDSLVLFPNEGGGDLPAQIGDLLVCRLSAGSCHVAVDASTIRYVAPG